MLKSNNATSNGQLAITGGQQTNKTDYQSNNQLNPVNSGQQQNSGQTCSQSTNLNQQNNGSPTSLPPHTPNQHPPNSATPQTPPETPENHTPPSALTMSNNSTNLSNNNNLIMGLPPHQLNQLNSQQLVHTQLPQHLQNNLMNPNGGHLVGQLPNGQQASMVHLGMHHPQQQQLAQQQQNYFKQQMSSMSPPISSWDVGSAAKAAAMNNSFVNQYSGSWYGHDSTLLT